MEYSIFKVEEKKDGRRNLFARAGLYKSWQCFRRMCAFSLFKNNSVFFKEFSLGGGQNRKKMQNEKYEPSRFNLLTSAIFYFKQ
jgi:hypothetical protein